MVAVVVGGGGRIDTGGGVRWLCGCVDDRGGGQVVVVTSLM